ncbi:YndM family protein [Ornithinibacillus salinisoli]|uniref:YndM family protein n=1 Tax=Ornithinibacillus salinisoli TaxID=1848459 RepID=A0ABW4W1A2_9BACI
MIHLKAIGIKLIVNIIVVYSIFGIFGNASLINLFWVSILVTGISYVIGDRVILPRFGNIVATIADFPLAFLSLWVLGNFIFAFDTAIIGTSLMAAFFITCCEPFIHAYIENHDTATKSNRPITTTNNLQTEFAEETDAQDITNHNDPDNNKGWY